MNLHKSIYFKLLNLMPSPPEIGGIIGAKNNIGIICYEDKPITLNDYSYSPNVANLNRVLSEWSESEIYLYGFYHTHIHGGFELSKQDVTYIQKILQALSSSLDSLYFPVVIPNDTIIAYKAELNNGCLSIKKDKINLFD